MSSFCLSTVYLIFVSCLMFFILLLVIPLVVLLNEVSSTMIVVYFFCDVVFFFLLLVTRTPLWFTHTSSSIFYLACFFVSYFLSFFSSFLFSVFLVCFLSSLPLHLLASPPHLAGLFPWRKMFNSLIFFIPTRPCLSMLLPIVTFSPPLSSLGVYS